MSKTEEEALFERFKELSQSIVGYNRIIVAYSGGVDSTLLSFIASHALGDKAQIVMATSPLLARDEEDDARQTAALAGFNMRTIPHPGWELEAVKNNRAQRCYECKKALFSALQALDEEAVVICGDNADDANKDRPGLKAADELSVRAPLKDHGFTKADIRAVAQGLKLESADKPSSPCLATRFPTDCPLTTERLDAVREAEYLLRRDYDFKLLRVRCDESGNARIQLAKDELTALDASAKQRALDTLLGLGFVTCVFDENGYRES